MARHVLQSSSAPRSLHVQEHTQHTLNAICHQMLHKIMTIVTRENDFLIYSYMQNHRYLTTDVQYILHFITCKIFYV